MKIHFNKSLNMNKNIQEKFKGMKSRAQVLLFDVLFFVYIIFIRVFDVSTCIWNRSLDHIERNIPDNINNIIPIQRFKICASTDYNFKYLCVTRNEYDENEDVLYSLYNTSYSNNYSDVLKKKSDYDYILVHHTQESIDDEGEICKRKLVRIFQKDEIEKIKRREDLDNFEVVGKNPFVFISINKNTENKFDISGNKIETKENETIDCYKIFKMFFVKGNILNRDSLEYILYEYMAVPIIKYPNYTVDVITNDIEQVQYVKHDEIEIKM